MRKIQFKAPEVDFCLPNNSAISEAFTKAGMAYGEMYADDINKTVTIAQASTYYPVTDFGLSSTDVYGMHLEDTSGLRVAKAGKYILNFNATMKCATANQNVSALGFVNTTPMPSTEGSALIGTANAAASIGGCGIITLEAGDLVRLGVENETGANNLIITHCTFTLRRIG